MDRIVGVSAVGCDSTMAAVSARKIVLVGRTCKRAEAVAAEIRYRTPLTPKVAIMGGDYPARAGAGMVRITAGINEKTGGAINRDPQGRLRLLDKKTAI